MTYCEQRSRSTSRWLIGDENASNPRLFIIEFNAFTPIYHPDHGHDPQMITCSTAIETKGNLAALDQGKTGREFGANKTNGRSISRRKFHCNSQKTILKFI